jgi:hypothetical protein
MKLRVALGIGALIVIVGGVVGGIALTHHKGYNDCGPIDPVSGLPSPTASCGAVKDAVASMRQATADFNRQQQNLHDAAQAGCVTGLNPNGSLTCPGTPYDGTMPGSPPTTPAPTQPAPVPNTSNSTACTNAALLAAAQADPEDSAYATGSALSYLRCSGGWATALIEAPGQQGYQVLFQAKAGTWVVVTSGSDMLCSGAGVPENLFHDLSCN